ncbi:MAG: ChbG/HpnK family deacetylase [Bryobacterales bacterium]|nr:ChbG/HpnK family deacetylase [Bryobacterales bacterium]
MLRAQLIVNADDFGFTRDVNEGIVEAHQRGIVTAATLMANGAAFDHAVALWRRNPSLDVGCHLVLVGGGSLSKASQDLPAGVPDLLEALAWGRLDVYAELAAQVRKILDAGVPASHLDTHKHTHLAPPVLGAVARISAEFGIPWVRRPFDVPGMASHFLPPWRVRAAARGLGLLQGRFSRVLREHGCRTTDHFAGFVATGRFHTAELAAFIRALPSGSTEFMCHPGFCTGELRGARTRLKESRVRELEALTAPEVRRALEERGAGLANFRDLRGSAD